MKKYFCFFILISFVFLKAVRGYAEENLYFKTIGNEPIYENRNGSLISVGTLEKEHVYKAIRHFNANWYEVQCGKDRAFVAKARVAPSTQDEIVNENKHYTFLGNVIELIKDTTVYDNSTGKLIPFTTLYKGLKVPIISHYGNWYRIEIAGRIGFIHKSATKTINETIQSKSATKVPVLMYHHLLRKSENKFTKNRVILNVEQFEEQMNYLYKNNYHTISLEDLENFIRGHIRLKEKAVLITFDDGHKTNYLYAYPILKKLNFHAAAFIITERIATQPVPFNPDDLQFLSTPEMEEMKTHFEFGSHTHALHQLTAKNEPFMLIKKPSEVYTDLVTSREKLGGTPYFCYPFGRYNKNIIELVKKAGYRMALSTKEGYATTSSSLYEVERFGVYPQTTLNDFEKIVKQN